MVADVSQSLTPGTVVLAGCKHRSGVTPTLLRGNVRIQLQLPIRSVHRSILIKLVHPLSQVRIIIGINTAGYNFVLFRFFSCIEQLMYLQYLVTLSVRQSVPPLHCMSVSHAFGTFMSVSHAFGTENILVLFII